MNVVYVCVQNYSSFLLVGIELYRLVYTYDCLHMWIKWQWTNSWWVSVAFPEVKQRAHCDSHGKCSPTIIHYPIRATVFIKWKTSTWLDILIPHCIIQRSIKRTKVLFPWCVLGKVSAEKTLHVYQYIHEGEPLSSILMFSSNVTCLVIMCTAV